MDTLFVALRVILSLAAVLALLWYAQHRISRGKKTGKTADLVTVVGRQGIGLKASVVVVDVDGTRFLLGVTEHAVNVLHSQDTPDTPVQATADAGATPADAGSSTAVFASALAGVTNIDAAAEHGLRPRRNQQQTVQASGSILSPATWKQTAAALRQIR